MLKWTEDQTVIPRESRFTIMGIGIVAIMEIINVIRVLRSSRSRSSDKGRPPQAQGKRRGGRTIEKIKENQVVENGYHRREPSTTFEAQFGNGREQ